MADDKKPSDDDKNEKRGGGFKIHSRTLAVWIALFGVLALLLFMVAYWFCTVAFFSVWCFFAAILSVVIYLNFKYGNEHAPDLMRHRA